MGNIQETANFVNYNGDTGSMMHTVCTRSDKIHFQAMKSIRLTAVGLCSPISENAYALLRICDTLTKKELLSQRMNLTPCRFTPYRFYDLQFPIDIRKDRYYTIYVEIHGGATHTYLETHESSRHNFFSIEITRQDLSPKFKKLGRLRIQSTETSEETPKRNRDEPFPATPKASTSKKFSSAVTRASEESRRSKTVKFTPEGSPEESQVMTVEVKSGSKPTETSKSAGPLMDGRRSTEKPRVQMNLISGIMFKSDPLSLGCC